MSALSIMHGGRLDAARRAYPQAPQPWVDLSTGVNPHAYPLRALAPEVYTRLPDDDAFAACEAAARLAYGAPAATEVVIGAGAQQFIQLLPRAFPVRHAAVLGFTYAEHAACWSAGAVTVESVETPDALAQADVGVIVNPNNPDGRLVAPDEITALAARMAAHDGLLVVDESFIDFIPEGSVASRAPDNVIVLRSFGKAYGLPGLRLGFALCAPARAAPLRAALGPWAVSGPALAIGAHALSDVAWREVTAARCAQDAARLDALLTRAGFVIVGGAPLYQLAAHSNARRWFGRLAEHGVLTRAFPERADWLRFGLLEDEAAWSRLAAALEVGCE